MTGPNDQSDVVLNDLMIKANDHMLAAISRRLDLNASVINALDAFLPGGKSLAEDASAAEAPAIDKPERDDGINKLIYQLRSDVRNLQNSGLPRNPRLFNALDYMGDSLQDLRQGLYRRELSWDGAQGFLNKIRYALEIVHHVSGRGSLPERDYVFIQEKFLYVADRVRKLFYGVTDRSPGYSPRK